MELVRLHARRMWFLIELFLTPSQSPEVYCHRCREDVLSEGQRFRVNCIFDFNVKNRELLVKNGSLESIHAM
jgi:hypothetical protein